MTDPLSVTASAAGIVSLGITVCQGLIDYYQKYKDKARDVAKTTQSIETVLSTLISLESILKTRKFSPSQGALVTTIEGSIKACVESIDDLREELERIKDPGKTGFRATVRAEIQQLAYPFRVGTLARLRADVQEIRSNISFVIDTLNMGQLGDVQNGMSDVKATLASMRTSQIREQDVEWLEAPDPSSDYNDASEKRQAGTGRWFVEGTQFGTWLHGDCTFLWLNGLAGCGKSVLSSTVIQKLVNHTRVHHGTVAFYFFKFSDTSKQDLKGLLRSLLLQFSYQSPTGSEVLASLHSRNKYGEPPVSALKDALKEVLSTLMNYYIVIDALDEAPRGKRRKEVLEYLSQMRSWEFVGMHMLVTSRDELDIRQSLKCIAELEISLENKEVGEDIRSFIVERLRQDTLLRKWHKYSQEIENALIDGASGMFRWVDCQFSSLADCDTLFSLRQTLKSLPVDLNETYDRALEQVAHNHKDDAKRLLMWLCHAKRPLKVTEVMHILAIDLDVSHRFEPDRCRVDPRDLLKICPSLTKIVGRKKVHYNTPDLLIEDASLLLAHFSVREYLLLGQILPDCAVDGGGKALVADDLLARTSLYYLLQFDETNLLTGESEHEYPLIDYAVDYGFEHLRASKEQPETRKLAHSLFAARTGACLSWARVFDIRRLYFRDWDILPEQLATPLFYATKLELVGIVHELLTTSSSKADINKPWEMPIYPAPAMSYTPLQAAVELGNMELTEILIKSGANPHVLDETTSKDMGDEYGKDSKLVKFSALTVGASNNRDTAIDLLLSKGVDPNHVVDRQHRTALDFACQKQAVKAVEALIRGGADVSNETLGPLESETGWTSLHWTFHEYNHGNSKLQSCKDIVRLLVKAGADPAKRNAAGATPVLLALEFHAGYSSISEMGELFYSGAISERDKHGRGPLHFLAREMYFKNPETTSSESSLLESLLAAGVSLDSQDSEGRTPLATAAEIFDLFILNALLDAGANSKIVDKNGSPPLYILFRSPEAANYYHSYTAEELCAAADRLCNEEVGYEYCDANGRSVAHVAAENGPIEMIEALVGFRANFLSVDHEGSTALGKLEWRILGHSLQLRPGVKPRPNKEDDVEGESRKESGQSGDRPEDEAERPTWHMREQIYSNDRRKPTLTLDDLPDAFDRFFFRLRSPIARFEEFMAVDIGFSDTLAHRKLFGHLLIRETARNGRWDIVDRMLDAAESHFRLDTSTMVESVIDAANIYQFQVDAYPLGLKENHALRGKADYVNFFVAVNTLDFEAVSIYTNLGVDVTPNSKMKRACIQRLQHLMDDGVADNMFQITEIYRKLTTAA